MASLNEITEIEFANKTKNHFGNPRLTFLILLHNTGNREGTTLKSTLCAQNFGRAKVNENYTETAKKHDYFCYTTIRAALPGVC